MTAKALMALGSFDDAATAFEGAAASQPQNADLSFNLGYACTVLGKFADAIVAYRQAIAIKPDFAEAHFRLGSVPSENGHIAEGFEH
jgi:Flp pilus assembly protein TadD